MTIATMTTILHNAIAQGDDNDDEDYQNDDDHYAYDEHHNEDDGNEC